MLRRQRIEERYHVLICLSGERSKKTNKKPKTPQQQQQPTKTKQKPHLFKYFPPPISIGAAHWQFCA